MQENVHDTLNVSLFVGHENSDPDQNSAAYEQGRHCLLKTESTTTKWK